MSICSSIQNTFSKKSLLNGFLSSNKGRVITNVVLSILSVASLALFMAGIISGGDVAMILTGLVGLVVLPPIRFALQVIQAHYDQNEIETCLDSSSVSEVEANLEQLQEIGFFKTLPAVARFFKENPEVIDEVSLVTHRNDTFFNLHLNQEVTIPLDSKWSLHLGQELHGKVVNDSLWSLGGMQMMVNGEIDNPIRTVILRADQTQTPYFIWRAEKPGRSRPG